MKNLLSLHDECFVFSYKKSFYKYPLLALEVIICDKPYLTFCIEDRVFLLKGSMKSLTSYLPSFFIQISRQVIVNVNFIKDILQNGNKYEVRMLNNKKYEMSQRRYKEVIQVFKQYAGV